MTAEAISDLFSEFGDFYAYKDTENSCFFEFFYIDPQQVPDRKIETFFKVILSRPDLNVVKGCVHQEAPRFVSHDKFEYMWGT